MPSFSQFWTLNLHYSAFEWSYKIKKKSILSLNTENSNSEQSLQANPHLNTTIVKLLWLSNKSFWSAHISPTNVFRSLTKILSAIFKFPKSLWHFLKTAVTFSLKPNFLSFHLLRVFDLSCTIRYVLEIK